MKKAVLFDLDGTLLPMDDGRFMEIYLKSFAAWFARLGYEPERFVGSVMSAAKAMAENDGSETNETVLWNVFANVFGEEARKEKGEFDGYYAEGFKATREACRQDPRIPDIVRSLRERGCKVVLATNPMLPMHAMVMRIGWTGLEPSDFDLITSYEDFRHAKPNPDYYLEIAERIGIPPEECVMVGNDADEDLSASSIGMDVFLLTDCLVNRSGKDLSDVPKGNLDDLRTYLDEMTS